MKKIVFLLIITMSSICFVAAQPKIEFDTLSWDFGPIFEQAGPVTAVFPYTNKGNQGLVITSVRASCGCTIPEYSKDTIAPGEKGYVDATYNPLGRPGPFTKTITVTSNDESNSPIILTIKGNVVPKEKTIEDNYPLTSGNIRMKTNFINFGNVTNKQMKTDTLYVYNQGKTDITFKGLTNTSEAISVKFIPETLPSKKEGKVAITFDGAKHNDLGFAFKTMTIISNDEIIPDNIIQYSATVSYDFSTLTSKQMADAPKVLVSDDAFDVGTKKAGEKFEVDFYIKNSGKAPLNIVKSKSNCPCISFTFSKTTIKKGKSAKLHVVYDTSGKNGVIQNTITIYTNSPSHPVVLFTIKGNIEK